MNDLTTTSSPQIKLSMRQFQVPNREQVDAKSQQLFDVLQKQVGMVPNLYATIGYSSNALAAYLDFQQTQTKGSFKAKEREAIFLAVSQVNGCNYCLAAHTALGKRNGFTEEETLALRAGTHDDEKLWVITQLAADITRSHGRPNDDLVEAFFGLGYTEKALVDLLALVADKTFANYVHNITQVDIDFPAAQPLPQQANA